MSLDSGTARTRVDIPNTSAVNSQPRRSWSGSIAQAIAGTSIKAPKRLHEDIVSFISVTKYEL